MARMKHESGFTLIELMIVVVIMAILAAIALPSYQESVKKSRRSDAQALLLNFAQAQERHFTQNLQYATAITGTASKSNLGWTSTNSSEGYYKVEFVPGTASTTAFTARAVPTTGSPQLSDAKCTAISLDNLGIKGKTGAGSLEDCW